MRVALIRQRYRPDGGAERFVARAMEALSGQGVEVVLMTRDWPRGADGVRVERCNPPYVGSIWRDLGFALCVCRRLRAVGADLVQSHERMACADIFRAGDGLHRTWLAQRRRTTTWWGRVRLYFNPYHFYALAAEARALRGTRLRAVICGSEMIRAEIGRAFPEAASKAVVLYNGVDCERFHPQVRAARDEVRARLGIADAALVLVFVGSGFYRKGLAQTLAALADLPATVHLLVVGHDKNERRYRHTARALGIEAQVHFLGRQGDPRPFYGAADALILPALYDPSPNVVLEAMACGLPVVISTMTGTSELVTEGHTGFVCDALDVAALARACRTLLDRARGDRMGAAARAAIEPYDLPLMGARFVAFYEDLLKSRMKEHGQAPA